MPDAIKPLVVRSVDYAIRTFFPKKYFSLCHAYAVVGANVASIALGGEYRPVAGLAVFDCGAGCFMRLIDNKAFSREMGGAYHCWIESCPKDGTDKELIDIIFKHNSAYAKSHKLIWRKTSSYLWGRYRDIVVDAELEALPQTFPEGKVWLGETLESSEWMRRHLAQHIDEYIKITAFALRKLKDDARKLS